MAILGCIADDFTGASDAASFLVKGGMSVQLYNGIPENTKDLKPVQAIVIALKSAVYLCHKVLQFVERFIQAVEIRIIL